MSIRTVRDRRVGFLWGLDVADVAKVNALLAGARLRPFRNRFYGVHVFGVAIGVWVSRRERIQPGGPDHAR